MAGRRSHPESTIVITENIGVRASVLVDKVAKTDVFEYIKVFELGANFGETYFKDLITKLLEDGEHGAAAKVMIQAKLINYFDVLPLLKKLGEKGKKNREYATEILKACGQFVVQIILFFSTETHFEFAFEVLQEFKLQLN